MGRTWVVRGAAAAVVAVLMGAWAVGVFGLRDSPSPSPDRDPPASPDTSVVSDNDDAVAPDRAKPPRAAQPARPEKDVKKPKRERDEPSPTDEPSEPSDPAPTTPSPTPRDPDTTHEPVKPPPTTPNGTPDQPTDECTDLLGVLDCVLNPITAQP